MSSFLQIISSRTPVTALCLLDDLVVSADGPFLRIYHYETGQLLFWTNAFDDQTIHGIAHVAKLASGHVHLLIWGRSMLRLVILVPISKANTVPGPQDGLKIFLGQSTKAPGWILALAVNAGSGQSSGMNCDCTAHAAFLTAQNVLYTACPTDRAALLVHEVAAGPRCILYSANLIWDSSFSLLVAAGTAFGDIIVWSTAASPGSTACVHYILTGHEGSIFGLQISERLPLDMEGQKIARFLASCSDDRTIRIWLLREDPGLRAPGYEEGASGQYLEQTGFLSKNEKRKIDDLSSSLCVASAMGHASRIWGVRYINAASWLKTQSMKLLSIGEDATSQVWELDEKENGFALHHRASFAHHFGKNIWSVAVDSAANPRIVTGGADGAITARRLQTDQVEAPLSTLLATWSMESMLESADLFCQQTLNSFGKPAHFAAVSAPKNCKADFFRSYIFIQETALLMTTNEGLVLLFQEDETGFRRWSHIATLSDIAGYSVAAGVPQKPLAFLAGAEGAVYVFDMKGRTMMPVFRVGGKVAGLFVELVKTTEDVDTYGLVATLMGNSPPQHIILAHHRLSEDILVVRRVVLPLEPSVMVTSMTHGPTGRDQWSVFLGLRNGDALMFSHGGSEGVTQPYTIPRVHRGETITGLRWLSGKDSQDVLGWLVSVGRDGACAVNQIPQSGSNVLLVHKLTLSLGSNLEGLYISPKNELFVYGFHGTRFIFHNASLHRSIMTVESGGVHRVWTFKPNVTTDGGITGGRFAWTKASQFMIYTSQEANHRVIQPGGHGREIKACAIAPVVLSGSKLGPLIATGAEDTDIRLSSYDGTTFRCVSILRKHVTGIQSLKWSSDGRFLFSSGGFEEFFVWRLRSVPSVEVGVVRESACPMSNEKSDLRITSFAVEDISESKGKQDGDAMFLITMVYSNSTIRTFTYISSNSKGTWTLRATHRYTSACLTQCSYLSVDAGTSILLTAATDGHISLWSMSGITELKASPDVTEIEWLGTIRVHQSSVKAMSVVRLNRDNHLILSGGDDNALGLTHCVLHKTGSPGMSVLLIPRAHAAAITATALWLGVSSQMKFGLYAVSGSNDQRVRVWGISMDLERSDEHGVVLRKLGNGYTAVADVSSMALFPSCDSGPRRVEVLLSAPLSESVIFGPWLLA
ncbi:WD40 repeat-like protein [Trichodelitschia bisporula]|uniref:WD40 repeat-like protein n=1 Tax=Trichodelitschia bisporula TaxID=703511 RepID=A0A6G1I400_9PEZI|nr:WD40 repeat-like protein [Trichodelitschia bisporula]